jgi:hypothetical protein
MEKKAKRKKIFTLVPDADKRKLQLRYARILILSQTASLLLVTFLFTIIFAIIMNVDTSLTGDTPFENFRVLVVTLFSMAIATSVLFTWAISIRLSHKILGPLFRIEKLLKQVLETGDVIPITIRKDDELQNIVQLLNKILERQKIADPIPEKVE